MKKQFQEEKTCACCGKTMYVLHPSRWAYKQRKGKETYTWYCSWKCMRKDETVERRMTQENYEKAVEMAIRGEDYLEYLKKCGAKNPSATWCYIKKKLAETHPQKLEMLPEKNWARIEDKQAAKKKEKKKPQLAEVAKKVPPAIRKNPPKQVTMKIDESGKAEWKETDTEGNVCKTTIDENGYLEVTVEATELKVKSVFSNVIKGGFFAKGERGVPMSIRTYTTMTLVAKSNPFDLDNQLKDCKLELTKEEWLKLTEEIREALDKMEI